MTAAIKLLHIAALVVWCAGLITLPLLLGLHRHIAAHPSPQGVQYNYQRFRKLSHVTYTAIATPAAVVAIAAGTALIFVAQVFEVWLLLKLGCVAGMTLAHAWLGHLIVQSGERDLSWRMPWPGLALVVALPCMLGVLWLVLAKPDLGRWVQLAPAWMAEPLGWDVGQWLTQWFPGLSPAQEVEP